MSCQHTDARKELKAAREELERVSKQDRKNWKASGHKGGVPESDAFLKANDRVIKAEQALPWWKR